MTGKNMSFRCAGMAPAHPKLTINSKARIGVLLAKDTVGEFLEQRTYAFRPTEFKELTQLKLNSPTVSPAKQTPTLILLQPIVEWGVPCKAIGQLWP